MREFTPVKTTKDLKHFVRHCVRWYRRRWRSDGTPVREDADPLGYQVRILEQHDWDRAADIVAVPEW